MLPTQYMLRALELTNNLLVEDSKQRVELKLTQEIEFSQASVAPTFTDGSPIKDLTRKLISGEIDILSIPPIRVVYMQRRWFTLDNRRLRAFKDAFMPKIRVVVSDFSDPHIKKEFFSKKTNKSITDGGMIRVYGGKSDENIDSGIFDFTKRVLNWTFEQLTESFPNMKYKEPLPAKFLGARSYYLGFLELILEEARASLQSGVEALEKSKVEVLALTVLNVKKSKKSQNPSTLIFSKQFENSTNKEVIKPNDAYLLAYGINDVQPSLKLLALASYVPNEDIHQVTFKVVFDEEQLDEIPEAFAKQAKWQAKPLGSLVTHMRMFNVCTTTPDVTWLDNLLTGDLQNNIISPANILPSQYPQHLNDSQKIAIQKFLDLKQGLQLVQGPPGTGKTSMVVELLKLLMPQGKILVCAPSNKAIQVLADKFSSKYPEVSVILNGVEDKLPKDHDRLQEIFIHLWGPSKLAHLAKMKEDLWTLLPDSVFLGTPQQIKFKLQKACETITSIHKDFLKLEEKFIKYNILCLNKEDIERFILANKKYIDLVSNDLIFSSALSSFIAKEKVIDHGSKALLESNLMPFFNHIKKPLMEISEILTKIEYYLNTVDVETHLLNYSPIIFSTLSVSGRKSLRKLSKIESLIIDEAGQAVEAETLIPFSTQPKKCLLIGDPKQLPATVLSPLSKKLKFERSMMSRLIEDCKQVPSILTTQYRMHPEIRQWPSAQYYGSNLQDGPSILQRPTLMENASPFLAPYAFINIQGRETSSGHSFENRQEVEFIVKLLHHLETTFPAKAISDVGIITFYKEQALLLQENFKHSHPKIKIQTVDSFQGDENNIIIISFVRSNPFGNVGFIKDFRRLNVALTRAKHSLILVGNAHTFEKGKNDVALLIKDAKERKCFFEQNIIEEFLVGMPKNENQRFHKPANQNIKKTAICHYFNSKPNSCNKGDKCDFLHTNRPVIQKQQAPLSLFKNQNKRDEKAALDIPATVENQIINLHEPLEALENQMQFLTLNTETRSAAINIVTKYVEHSRIKSVAVDNKDEKKGLTSKSLSVSNSSVPISKPNSTNMAPAYVIPSRRQNANPQAVCFTSHGLHRQQQRNIKPEAIKLALQVSTKEQQENGAMTVRDKATQVILGKEGQIITVLDNKRNTKFDMLQQTKNREAYLIKQATYKKNDSAMCELAELYLSGALGNRKVHTAHQWLFKAANQNNSHAMCLLAKLYENGDLGKPNLNTATEWLEKAAERNNRYALAILGQLYLAQYEKMKEIGNASEQEQKGLKEKIMDYLKRAANKGGTRAIWTLANIYELGTLGEKSLDEAIVLYAKAAKLGSPSSLVSLNDLVLAGKFNSDDFELILEETSRCVAETSSDLAIQLGLRQISGELGKNPARGLNMLKQAAEHRNQEAMRCLVKCYQKGRGCKPDLKLAAYWLENLKKEYEIAARAGNVEAMMELGELYLEGAFGKVDLLQAEQTFLLAVETKDIDSMLSLSKLYLEGRFGDKNIKKGQHLINQTIDICQQRAEQQDSDACDTLHEIYLNRTFHFIDYTEAGQWLRASAKNGNMASIVILAKLHLRNRFEQPMPPKILKEDLISLESLVTKEHSDPIALAALLKLTRENFEDSKETSEKIELLTLKLRTLLEQESATNPSAALFFVKLSEEGKILPRNLGDAAKWLFHLSCLPQQNINVDTRLHKMLTCEGEVPQEKIKIVESILELAKITKEEAPYRIGRILGDIYISGHLIKIDVKQAILWYQKAAKLGNSTAMFALGKLYETQNFGQQNIPEAISWYKLSSEKSNQKSIDALRCLCHFNELSLGLRTELEAFIKRFDSSKETKESNEVLQLKMGASRNSPQMFSSTTWTPAYVKLPLNPDASVLNLVNNKNKASSSIGQ